jgi:hypothetical protein
MQQAAATPSTPEFLAKLAVALIATTLMPHAVSLPDAIANAT